MRTVLKVVLVVAVMVTPMGAMSDEKGDIKYRQAIMKGNSSHAGAIALIAKGNVSQDSALQGHAHALLELAKIMPAAFKNNSAASGTRAKTEVWSDWAGFEGKAQAFEKAAMAIVTASKSGPGAVKAKLGDLFDTCKSCHKNYRNKDKN